MHLNRGGFSLLELTIAAGVLSILMLALASFHSSTKRAEQKILGSSSIQELDQGLARFMYNPDNCLAALGGTIYAASPLAITTLKNPSGAVAFQVGAPVGNTRVTISSLSLDGFNQLETQGTAERGIVSLVVKYAWDAPGFGSSTSNSSMALLVSRDTASKAISTCGAVPYENWKLQAATSNIYSSGNVGIGTGSPAVPLEVTGYPVTIGDQSSGGTRLSISDVSGSKQLSTTNNAPIVFTTGVAHDRVVTIENNRIGVRSDSPLIGLIDVAQVMSGVVGSFLLNHGESQKWTMSLANGGNELDLIRVASSGLDKGNFVLMNPLAVKTMAPPPGNLLTVNGTSGGSSAWANLSDRRLKTDLRRVRNALSLLVQLRPVSYLLRDHPESGKHFGFIAQEIEKVLPEVVIKRGGAWMVKLDELVALLIEAEKELNQEIEREQAELDGFLRALCSRFPDDEVCGT